MKFLQLAGLFSLILSALAQPAFAAKCYVREYPALAVPRGQIAQIAKEAGTDQAPIDFTSGHAESAAFAGSTNFIRLWCDAQASNKFGAAPVATNSNSPQTAGQPEYYGVVPGNKVSVVANP